MLLGVYEGMKGVVLVAYCLNLLNGSDAGESPDSRSREQIYGSTPLPQMRSYDLATE